MNKSTQNGYEQHEKRFKSLIKTGAIYKKSIPDI
jgi:hypothetical protein